MDEVVEKAYSPKEVFTTLDIGESTLRKWCLALEKNGYGFIRNDKNSRLYVEGDLVVLRHFQNLIKQHNMPLDNAAIVVIDRFGKGTFEPRTVAVPDVKNEEQRDLTRSDNEVIAQLMEYIKKQDEFNKELLERLNRQQKYIEERLDRVDERQKERDDLLLKSIRETQETKQLLLAAKEEEEPKKPVRKGILSWFSRE